MGIGTRLRTGYSFRQAAGSLSEIIDILEEMGEKHAPITDRASTFGWVRWASIAEGKGLKPVFGVELGVTPSLGAKRPIVDFWTFIARGSVAPINELVGLATSQFRYTPLLTIPQALEASKEVSVIMGHRPQLEGLTLPREVYLELSPATPRPLIAFAGRNKVKLAKAGVNRYPRPEDASFYRTLVGRNAEVQSYPQHMLTDTEWAEYLSFSGVSDSVIKGARKNADKILEASEAKLIKAELPKIEWPHSLRELCLAGAKRIGVNLKNEVYKERLEKELTLIREKKYEDYFQIVADLVTWARGKMIVGPARGSSCGSLVCYLLGITTIDPIPFGLIFERFVDINRSDMPDIDIDFSDQRRHLVFDYLNDKYGSEYVARLGTVALFRPKSALNEVGGALNIPRFKMEAVSESLIERSSGDARALLTLEDTLRESAAGSRLLKEHPEAIIAARFEGHPRHYSQHAAGVVIAKDKITNYVAIDHRSGATMCDKKDAEDGFNLLKIDALGLTQLSVFEDALRLAGLPENYLETVPLDDKAAFEVINEGRFAGIFQYTGIALQSLARQFKSSEFNDIVSVTALARPGPLASGGASEWVKRRSGASPVTYPHPIFEPYLKDTLGIVIYQEQVMNIGREIGDLDWGQVTALRKAMSRSLGKEFFDQFGDPWKAGAIRKGVDRKIVDKVWDDLCAYGSWSFNKSHSVAYGLISYLCAHLKAHWPEEFAAATLNHEKNEDAQLTLLRELDKEGVGYIPVDKKESTTSWEVIVDIKEKRRKLVGPLQNVIGLGPKLVSSIVSAKARGEPLPARAAKLLEKPRTPLDTLYPVRRAIASIDLPSRNIYTPVTEIIDAIPGERDKEILIIATPKKINPRNENEAIKIAQRGYELKEGPLDSLNLIMGDDTGEIFAKVSRYDFDRLATDIIDRGRIGKALYAIKGVLKSNKGFGDSTFRMIMVKGVRYLGDLEQFAEAVAND